MVVARIISERRSIECLVEERREIEVDLIAHVLRIKGISRRGREVKIQFRTKIIKENRKNKKGEVIRSLVLRIKGISM